MVFGNKPKKPNSVKPSDKRKISLLNSDFKATTGIDNIRFKKVATHTLSPCQLAAGDDRRIHHGINSAHDAITAVGTGKEAVGILDNDFKAAFDFMVLISIINLYTLVVVYNVLGKGFLNLRWSVRPVRQGDRSIYIFLLWNRSAPDLA